jgi:hypothetical protein
VATHRCCCSRCISSQAIRPPHTRCKHRVKWVVESRQHAVRDVHQHVYVINMCNASQCRPALHTQGNHSHRPRINLHDTDTDTGCNACSHCMQCCWKIAPSPEPSHTLSCKTLWYTSHLLKHTLSLAQQQEQPQKVARYRRGTLQGIQPYCTGTVRQSSEFQ